MKKLITKNLREETESPSLEKSHKQAYEKIIFKENVFTSACDFFRGYKNLFVITSLTPNQKYLPFFKNILQENNLHFGKRVLNKNSICNNDEILKTSAQAKDADLLIAFGAGKVADITKITAQKLSIPYCVIPTTITHFGLFNNIAYIFNNQIPELIKTDSPVKVFVDIGMLKKSPESFINSSILFSVSLLETLFVLEVKRCFKNRTII